MTNYTEHTLRHSLGVESVYDVLLDNDYTILTDEEKYLLIAATLLHDIGMVGNKEDLSKIGYEAYRRNGHHSFSKDVILREASLLGFDRTEASLIADIAAAHRKTPLESLEESVASGIGGHVRLRLLGALLRFTDELHITKDRSSELVVNIVQTDANSLQHHERHLSIIGVSRNPNDKQKIMVSAIVHDWEAEKLMDELIQEITKKHEQVEQILSTNKIVITGISKQYRDEMLVTKEVLLALLKSNLSTYDFMDLLDYREGFTVTRVIGSLVDTSVIEPSSVSPDQYQIKTDSVTFKFVFNQLKDTDKLIEFMQSSYVKDNIAAIFDKIALEIYSHSVTGGDKDDRLQLIKNSPTVLNNLLNKKEMNNTFGQMDRSVILDLLILNGYMQDVAKNPALSKEDEIVLAMQNVQNNIHKNLGSFLRFVQHLNPEQQQIIQEALFEQIEKKLENHEV
ncbi:HD domain-containing protein [Lysinibacillus sp. NPDC097162]|uniref:HD domain-containing protein n=1 Tax=Lysinibacillus sp. NPDC097162 TaxID=3364140 RepID=UPI00382C9940